MTFVFMQHSSPTRKLAFISQLRFPLAALVVLIHSGICEYFTEQSEQTAVARQVIHAFSVGLTSVAVPLFFAISGYLFFMGMHSFSIPIYKQKLQRRFKTLLIPYLTWILIAFLLYASLALVKGEPLTWPLGANLWWGCRQLVPDYTCLLDYHVNAITAPLLVPLWFMRDLMLLAVCSPVIYHLLKRTGWLFILLIGIVFYTHIYPNWCGVSIRGLLFFSSGAIWAIQGKDPLAATREALPAACWTALLSLLAYVLLWGKVHWNITDVFNAIYVWSGMVVAIHWADASSRRHAFPKMYTQSSFFVYAVHTLFLFVLLKPLALHVQHMGVVVILAAYFGCYLLTLLLSVLSFKIVVWAEHGHGILTGIWSKAPTRQ